VTSFLTEVGFAFRALFKRPMFAITAIATLGLGIGGATSIFSVVNAVLLRPLPYADAGRLVLVWQDMRNRNVWDFPWPPADFADLRKDVKAFEGVAALVTGRQVIVGEGDNREAEQIRTGVATPNLFRLLGARVAIGSDFREADGTPPAPPPQPAAGTPAGPPPPGPPVRAILSHEFWQRRFGGNAAVVGTVASLGTQRFEIIGVLEPGFELLFPPGLNVERVPDIWTPLRIDFAAGSRINVFLRVIGRLGPGVPLEQAQREVDGLAADLRRQFPIKQTAGVHFRVEPMHADLVNDVRPTILALMGAVTFVLLIACANVVNLLLVRVSDRNRELAVRAALGSSRWRLVRQMLAESLVLAAAAIGLGVVLAQVGVDVLRSLAPDNLPRLDHVGVDGRVVTFAVLAGLFSIVVFGLLPAVQASSPRLMDLLRRSGRSGALAGGKWLRGGVAVAAVVLSFVLLVGSGLMIRSFVELQRAQPGYRPEGLLTFFLPTLQLPRPAARQSFVRELKARLEALPGVEAATAAVPLPLDGRDSNLRYGTEAALADPSRFQQATAHLVLPGYFETLGTRILDGRSFTEAENTDASHVVVIDRLLAAKAFPGRSPVGQTLLIRVRTDQPERFQVIGVVDHQRHASLARDGREAVFLPDGLLGHGVANRWAVRTSADPAAFAAQVRGIVSELNARAGVIEQQPMTALVDRARADTRFALTLVAVFAAIALVLAAVGLYGVLSTAARQRTAEIGVRMTFGAQPREIFRMMVGYGLALTATGLVIGIAAALALTRVIRSLLVDVSPTDIPTFAATALGFLVVAAFACGLPAWRASRLDPVEALREE